MKIELSTLVEACECMRQMRESEGTKGYNTRDYMRYLKAWAKFNASLATILDEQDIQVEVTND